MPDNEIRDQLADQLAAHLYDRGQHVAEWPEDERDLHRDPDAWTCFAERAEKVQALRYRKAADELLAAGWRPPAHVVKTAEELDGLPVRTLVTDKTGFVWRKVDLTLWCGWETGDFTAAQLLTEAPITVLCIDQAPTECCPDCGADECECPDDGEYFRGMPLHDVYLPGDAPAEAVSHG